MGGETFRFPGFLAFSRGLFEEPPGVVGRGFFFSLAGGCFVSERIFLLCVFSVFTVVRTIYVYF